MTQLDARQKLIAVATPLFAAKGLGGVSVRGIARAAEVNLAMISYYFGSKEGLYAAVLREQFAGLAKVAGLAATGTSSAEKFTAYLYECGICFHQGPAGEFAPSTASADRSAPECPCCLNNDAASFVEVAQNETRSADAGGAVPMAEAVNG